MTTAGAVDQSLGRSSVDCEIGHAGFECKEMAPSRAYVIVPGLAADVYALYALSVANPWYGFGYFGAGYVALGMASHHPHGYDEILPYDEWYGHPNALMEFPRDHFYGIVTVQSRNRDRSRACLGFSTMANRRAMARKGLDLRGIALSESELDVVVAGSEMILMDESVPGYAGVACLFALHIPNSLVDTILVTKTSHNSD